MGLAIGAVTVIASYAKKLVREPTTRPDRLAPVEDWAELVDVTRISSPEVCSS
jgi:hypothetical protein